MRGIPELEDLLAPAPGRADLEPLGASATDGPWP